MNRKFLLWGGLGCGVVAILVVVALVGLLVLPFRLVRTDTVAVETPSGAAVQVPAERAAQTSRAQGTTPQASVPTLTPPPSPRPVLVSSSSAQSATVPSTAQDSALQNLATTSNLLNKRYAELNPGVVNIGVVADLGNGQQAIGAGSGFVLDNDGHIVTNNHVIAQAIDVVAIFFNGLQAHAEVIGADDDSDLAIIKVAELPKDVHPLTVADSDLVEVGDWAIAIGNPFGLGSSMTLGVVSAIGRSIPSGATPFAIPQAIQTDAAINPGNSGGPLLNLDGQVIGVNAQIRTNGSNGNTGVGFAIPANVVRHVAPVLIVNGNYNWPWLGVEGAPIGLTLMEANNLDSQRGAYIVSVVPNGPAAQAGLQGAEIVDRNGMQIPVGGDVVIAIDGEPVMDFDDLSSKVAFKEPGAQTVLTVLRNGQQQDVTVTLEARPSNFGQNSTTGQ
ncbi:MAG: trypsin-like peptidase domain-containing protein [Caldilineaceae bacterium]